jgi:hypothetical protein
LEAKYGILSVRLGVPVDAVQARRLLLLYPSVVAVFEVKVTVPLDCQTPVAQVFEGPPTCQAPPSSRRTSNGADPDALSIERDQRLKSVVVTSREAVAAPPETAQSPAAYATLQILLMGLTGREIQLVPLLAEVYPFVPAFDPTRSAVELLNARAFIVPVMPTAAVQVVRFDASAVQTLDETRK